MPSSTGRKPRRRKVNCASVYQRSVHEDYLYIVHDALVLMAVKETIKWMKPKGYLHTSYAGRPVGNIPEFMPLYNSHNRDILQSFRFHCVLSLSIIDGKEINEEERKLCFGFSTPSGNRPRTEAYMGFENGNPFFGKDYTRC